MLCLQCKSECRILESRLTGPRQCRKRRRHQCLNPKCRLRFSTLELEDTPALRDFIAGRLSRQDRPAAQLSFDLRSGRGRRHVLFDD